MPKRTIRIKLDLVSAAIADVAFGDRAPVAFALFLADEVKQTTGCKEASFCPEVKQTTRPPARKA